MELNILRRLVGIIGGLLFLAILMLASYWPAIFKQVIRSDLRYYGRQVRASSLPLSEKMTLLDQLEAIGDRIEEGSKLGPRRWWETDEVVRELLKHKIDAEEAALIDRESGRVQRRLED